MMKDAVIIKAHKSGIVVVLDPKQEFEQLKKQVTEKFREAEKFFGDAKMAVRFEGRQLTEEEQMALVDCITRNSRVKILCIVENDPKQEKEFEKSLNQKLLELDANTGQFYKGNFRSGQVLEAETSIIILGDVHVGAKIISKGNIIILGALKGNVFAGAAGNQKAFVVALEMQPMQIRIAEMIARSPDRQEKQKNKEAKIAFAEDGNIYIETINKNTLMDLCL